MIEMRRVRFGNVEGLRRAHLGTAGEIWLADLCSTVWATREAMKLGALLVRYMIAPDPTQLDFGNIEAQIQVGREDVKFAVRLMQLYRAIEAFSTETDGIRAALHLTSVQRLKVIETHVRLDALLTLAPEARAVLGSRWVPARSEEPGTLDGRDEEEGTLPGSEAA